MERQKRSNDIRKQLGIFNINDKLTQYKINWWEHIQRMGDNGLSKKLNIGRYRNIGIYRNIWDDGGK